MPNYSGQSVGRYHVIEQLGSGGMATVYKAFDTRLERYVAMKFIRKEAVQDDTFLKRFEREAKALAILSHPNIVKIMDYGELQGAPYLVMEYIPGGTMKNLLGTPLPWQEAARLLIPITSALEYTHQHGIIHRDVKPSNFLLTEANVPMLSDFGIAKMIESYSNVQLTAVGVGIGTPEYMAPEQGQGSAIDHRVDIYALGIVLYELVTGKKPFRADTPMAVVFKHVSSPLPDPRMYVRDLPETLVHMIFKALAKKPDDRFQSMSEFGKSLEHLLQEPVSLPKMQVTNQDIASNTDLSAPRIPDDHPPVQYQMPAPTVAPVYNPSLPYTQTARPARKSGWMVGVLIPLVLIACLLVIILSALLISMWNKKNALAAENATSTSVALVAEEHHNASATARSEQNTREAVEEQATATAFAYTEVAATQQMQATQEAQAMTLTAVAIQQPTTTRTPSQGGPSNTSGWNMVIDDSFNDSTYWEVGTESSEWWVGSTEIGNGLLTWDATSVKGFVDYLSCDTDYLNDFTLSVRARQVSGPDNAAYGVYFRNNDPGDKYYFSINSNTKTYNFYLYKDSGWTTIFSQTDTNIHSTESGLYNEFTILAEGDEFTFYINDNQQPVRVVQDDNLRGGWTGLAIEVTDAGYRGVFQFDKFQLSIP